MPAWVLITFAAALVQTVRFSLQKRLRGSGLSSGGASFSRFLFAAPLAAALAAGVILATGAPVPGTSPRFWTFAIAGGLGQIIATMATVALFTQRNFAVGIAFTKTETVLVAAFSLVFLGEAVTVRGLAAILIGAVGVILISRPPGTGGVALFNRATLLGLIAGGFFGASAIGYRGATLALDGGSVLLRAAFTLAAVTTFQTLAMALWLSLREPGEMKRVLARWRMTALVGVTGMMGSLGWFAAFTLQNAAYVRALGQVELVFSFLWSWLIFRERSSVREVVGVAVLTGSILMLMLVI
jgi:drug/metabolite transporter (DMT)-like permease